MSLAAIQPQAEATSVDRPMVDLAFELQGRSVPRHYRAPLAEAVLRRLPAWRGWGAGTGIHRLHLPASADDTLPLSLRTRLVLRLPRGGVAAAQSALQGAAFSIAGHALQIGTALSRELLPWSTLYAHSVVHQGEDEGAFMALVARHLDALGVKGRVICGRRHAIDALGLYAHGLMVDQLDTDAALRLLQRGIGDHQHLGCGLFVPHKSASAVGAPM